MDDMTVQCRCGHQREAHEHYRRGTDCALCGAAVCASFRTAVDSVDELTISNSSGSVSSTG